MGESDSGGRRYAAFISYKHEPRDMAVAADIQRGLEHFRIPGAIRKETGRRRIGRVFRDREELGLTGDLSDTIREALAASEYLIVICSRHTRESVWVDREISLFLETHDVLHILTVITEGNPGEVLPERLLDLEKEPLSADYRLSGREARRRELPRIAAALLGCGYDDLVRRSQQYRAHRLAAVSTVIAAVSIAASGYFIWSRAQIVRSLQQAQISQARYLANEVGSLLEEDRDVTAAQLALHTVPEDRNLLPAQTWNMLENAAGAYLPLTLHMADNTRVIGELHSTDSISIIRENHDRDMICTLDSTDHIHVWDTGLRRDLLSFQETDEVIDLVLAGERLIVGTDRKIIGYNLSDGEVVWMIDRAVANTAYMGRGLYSLCTDESETRLVALSVLSADGERLPYLSVIDPEDGSILTDISLKAEDGEDGGDTADNASLSAGGLAVTEDSAAAAFLAQTDKSDYSERDVWLADLESGELTKTEVSLYSAGGMRFLQNGTLLVQGIPDKKAFDESSYNNGSFFGLMNTMGETSAAVYCLDASSGEIKWSSDIEYNQYEATPMQAESFAFAQENGDRREALYVTAANVLQIYDAQTGEKIRRYELADCVAFVGMPVEEDPELQSSLLVACSNGNMGTIEINDKEYNYVELFQSSDGPVFFYSAPEEGESGYLVHPAGTSYVLQYTLEFSDPDFELLQDPEDTCEIEYTAVTEDAYVVVRKPNGSHEPDETASDDKSEESGGSGDTLLELYSRKDRTLLQSYIIPEETTGDERYLGVTTDGEGLIYLCGGIDGTDADETGIYEISLEDGNCTRLSVPVEDQAQKEQSVPSVAYYEHNVLLQNDSIYYISETGNFCQYRLHAENSAGSSSGAGASGDEKNGAEDEAESAGEEISSFRTGVTEDELPKICALSVSPDGGYAFVSFESGASLLLNLKTETASAVQVQEPLYADASSASGAVCWDPENSRLAAAGERAVTVMNLNGEEELSVPYSGAQAVGVCFCQDLLLVACTDGRMNRYSLEDGKLIGTTTVATYSGTVNTAEECIWDLCQDDSIGLSVGGYWNEIDTEEWITLYSVPNCLAADKENGIFLAYASLGIGEDVLGAFPEYTLDDLIEKCRQLGNYEDLDGETLIRYGLSGD